MSGNMDEITITDAIAESGAKYEMWLEKQEYCHRLTIGDRIIEVRSHYTAIPFEEFFKQLLIAVK